MIYSIIISAISRWSQEEWMSACQILDTFLDAVRFGFFGESTTVSQQAQECVDSNFRSQVLRLTFDAKLENQSCLLVLVGMLYARLDDTDKKIGFLEISACGKQVPINQLSLSQLAVSKERHIRCVMQDSFDLQDPFVLFISFSTPLDKLQQDFLHRTLEVWEQLLIGGLPANGLALGESVIGAAKGYLSEPTVFHYAIKGILAHPVCLELLMNCFEANQNHLPVQSVQIQ